ncbi:MBL fold metallo-hydrolase [Lentzea aerocolonigenes]|uniref:MBL fold metallo-hydrolase n=1 Tax=Lentzea aerocolonigenes TaxID=68170 RepID=UPI0034E2570F
MALHRRDHPALRPDSRGGAAPRLRANTVGDAVAWLPEQRVLFTGDLFFTNESGRAGHRHGKIRNIHAPQVCACRCGRSRASGNARPQRSGFGSHGAVSLGGHSTNRLSRQHIR